MRFDDFALSAQALGAAVARAAPGRVGRTVYEAVAATARVAPSNTNLGMALLFAPLAAAARGRGTADLRRRLAGVLRGLSVDDARWAYRAIRLARPGGLGTSREAPVARRPSITLGEAMRLAAGRDTVAAEYARGFAVTFDLALAGLRRALASGLSLLEAVAQAHLELMAKVPDTLIARKAGAAAAVAIAQRARAVVQAGGVGTQRDSQRRGGSTGTFARTGTASIPERPRTWSRPRSSSGSSRRPRETDHEQPGRPVEAVSRSDREGLHRLLRGALHHVRRPRVRALHGHNYRAAAALEGPLDENAYVFDFTRLKRALRATVDRLDHRMLLPTKSALIHVTQAGEEVHAAYRDKRYVFPASDVVLLPIPNTTAEMLAWWIAQELRRGLGTLPSGMTALEVEVDESSGQRAFYREALDPPGRPGRDAS